jgi:predicted dinucleotide-binding enzyme
MATIGIIGSGMIGGSVARLAAAAGHEVIVSNSRGPDTLTGLVAELGPTARAATRAEASAAGQLLVVSIPLGAYPSLTDVDANAKVVMDTGNYYEQRDGQIPELQSRTLRDSQYLAEHLPGARVVKVFNNIFWKHLLHLARPAGAPDRSALPIAGDDAAAKADVTQFLDSIGWDAVDAGTLADSWRQEPGTPAYGPPYGPFDNEDGTTAGADVIRAALAAAGG